MLYVYYKKLLLLNDLKFRYTYLNKITNIIKSLYNKNVEFNIINLKYFYLNSDVYTQSIINKITKKRKKLYKIFKSSVRKVKIVDNK
jgi:ribosomal protein S3